MDLKTVSKKIFTSRWLFFGTAALAVYSLAGFLLLPYLASNYLKEYVQTQLAHELTLRKLRFNPFTFTVEVEGLDLKATKQAALISVDDFSANFDALSSLQKQAWTFSSIKLSDPFLRVVVQTDGRTNLSMLFKNVKSGSHGPTQQGAKRSVPKFLLEDVMLQGGKINFVDRRVSPAARVVLRSFAMDLEELATLPDLTGGYTISARTKAGETLKWRGSVSLNPIQSKGSLKLEAVKASTVWKFFRERISCKKPNGEMTLTGNYLFDLSGRQPVFTLSKLDFDISNLAVTRKDATTPLISLKEAVGRAGHLQWHKHSVALESLRIRDGRLRMQWDGNGIANWRKLVAGGEQTAEERTSNSPPSAGQGPPNAEGWWTEWSASLHDFSLRNFQVGLTDLTTEPSPEFKLASLDLDLGALSTDPDSTVDFDLRTRIESGGEMSAKGRASLWNRSVQGHAQVRGFYLPPLQPYLSQLTQLTLDSGSLDASGRFSYGNSGKEGKKGFIYQGQGKILSLRARTGESSHPPWGWDSMSCNSIHLSLSPGGDLELGKVKIVGPSGSLIIYQDKTVNLSRILIHAKNKTKAAKSEPFRIIANHIQLEQGSLEFADLSQSPRFSAQIEALEGSINGISSIEGTTAQIELNGQVNKNGMTSIRGETDLFHPTGTTKIRMDFNNIEMTRLTPYAVHFAGYRIASGKLSLDLHYRIENGKMLGRNRIIAQQFTLGERVQSPTAVDLPFKLAIALLRDSKGTIDIGLPVKGNLNNPQFDFGEIIRMAAVNFLKKIIAAPFSWLAGLVGYEKQDFETVLFEPGLAKLQPPEKEKLDKLSEALAKRPRLDLKIQGGYNPAADTWALKTALLRRKVASQQNLALKAGENPGPPVFHDPAVQKALEELFLQYYPAERLSDLKDDYRKTLQPAHSPADEKERAAAWTDFYKDLYRRIKKQMTIPESRLESLAESRGAAVRRFMENAAHVAPGRIRVVGPIRTGQRSGREVASKLSLEAAG